MEVSKSLVSPVGHEERVVPRYLRASTGSCHDFCKYGRHESFEKERPRHKVPVKVKHVAVKSFVAANTSNTAVKWKKPSRAKLKSSHATKILALNPPELTKSTDHEDEYCKKIPSPRFNSSGLSEVFDVEGNQACQLVNVINDDDLSLAEKIDHNNAVSDTTFSSVSRNLPSEQMEAVEVEIPLVSHPAIIKESKAFGQLNQTCPLEEVKQVTTPVCKGALTRKTQVIHRNVHSVKQSMSSASPKVKQTISASRIQGSSANPKINMGKSPRKLVKPSELKSATPRKKLTASVMKSKISPKHRASDTSSRLKSTTTFTGHKTAASVMKKTTQASLNVSTVQASKMNVNEKVSKKTVQSRMQEKTKLNVNRVSKKHVLSTMEEKKVLHPARQAPHRHPKIEDPVLKLRTHREESEDSVEEKTIYVINSTEQTVNLIDSIDQWSSPSMPSSSSSSLGSSFVDGQDKEIDGCSETHAEDETFSDYKMDNDQLESQHDVGKKLLLQQQHLGKAAALDKAEDPHRVKFRRGKIVDTHSTDSVGPRRLKFRQGRVLDCSQIDNAYNHKRTMFRKKEIVRHDTVPKTKTEIVMLRHQDVQDKKDVQGLFNDVIEVTASKLVESRKSKVKALVGAFETVISLQERKPTSLV